MQKSSTEFASHILRYVGIGMISGSIVHLGTLGGSLTRYAVLILLGIILFIIGTILEHGQENIRKLLSFIAISVVVSIGTGMVSGATQHYLDGPVIASYLLSIGLLIAYFSFIFREKYALNRSMVLKIFVIAIALFSIMYATAHVLPALPDHHATESQHDE